jgi:HK97 family phage major capsid protein
MGLEQIRARLLEISAALEGMQAGEDGYTDEQLTEIENLNSEFESLQAQLSAAEKVEQMKARAAGNQTAAGGSNRKTAPAATSNPTTRVEVGRSSTDRFGGFKSSGDFLMAVKTAGSTGQVAQQLQNVMYEKNGEDGGFLVPEDISNEIVRVLDESPESLAAQTRSFNVSGNSLSFPVDEKQPWNGGITAYWTAEGAPIKESAPKFAFAHMRLHKLAALVKATDELLDDTVALESYIKGAAPDAIMHKVNSSILTGDGVGKPQGILQSPFTYTVAKEAGQAADTINGDNLVKMYSHMIPSALPGAKWYINAGLVEALNGMKNSAGDLIFIPGGTQLNQAPYGVLLGRPVVPMMTALPGIGDTGDIVFANLKYYFMIRKAGVKQATSIHLHFDREITAFRFSLRVDGQVPFQAPVTTEFGNYQMSAFVKLADRA